MSDTATWPKNVLGGPLRACCMNPVTGFYRTGLCEVGPDDFGVHAVCIQATDDFLEFSKAAGNDLSTPRPEYDFPGLNAGDKWCLCAERWKEAYDAGKAPKLVLSATHESALEFCPLNELLEYAVDREIPHDKFRRHV